MKIERLPREKFPPALLEIPQPPENLYIIGELPPPNLIPLCVVGSRKFTSYGRECCEKLIMGLQNYPIIIVSGFAVGIDTIAHKTAIKAGLPTIAFPGSGLSKEAIFPKINSSFMEEILNAGGCFISEFEPDFKATKWCFPMRNRLMAGLSKAVLIIEAEEKSGTMVTARLALDYNRDVLAVPGNINNPSSRGTNKLIRSGAVPITSSEDLLEALGFEITKEKDIQQKLFADLSSEEQKVVDLLREPMPRDELIRNLGMPTAQANALLTMMEIKELIKEEVGEIHLCL